MALELKVERWGYLSIDTDEWLQDRAEYDEDLTEQFRDWAARNFPYARYAYSDMVIEWLNSLEPTNEASGIYGEGDPWVISSTYNHDTFLSNDIGYVFAHAGGDRLIVRHVTNYLVDAPENVDVYRFTGNEDSDAVAFDSGWATHANNRECAADWIIESAYKLWANGGGKSHRIGDLIKQEDDGNAHLRCPRCGDDLIPYSN